MKNQATWLDKYPIVDADHVHDLETRAAIGEFMNRMPRHLAEAKAHEDYKKDQLTEAAGHHLNGIKSSHAAGDHVAAKKHGIMYALALKALGHDPVGEVPSEVSTKAKNMSITDPIHSFRAHRADQYSLPKTDEKEAK